MDQPILIFAGIVGSIIAFRFEGFPHRLISLGLTIAVIITLTGNGYVKVFSLISLVCLGIGTAAYGINVNHLSKSERISISIMGIFSAVKLFFMIQHYPFDGLMKILLVIPVALTLITYMKLQRLTKEWSFMIFWVVFSLIQISKLNGVIHF